MTNLLSALEKLSQSAVGPNLALPENGKVRRPFFFATLIAEFFGRAPKLSSIAFVSPAPKQGSTHCARLFCEEMALIGNYRTAIVHPGEQLPYRADLLPTSALAHADWRREVRPFDIGDQLRRRGKEVDVVVVDGGALDKFNTAVLPMLAAVQGIVLVVESGRTTHAQITRSASVITSCGGRLLGIAFNKRTYPIPQWLYRILP